MKAKSFAAGAAALALLLLLSVGVLAMSSPNYVMDWFVQLSGGGGGRSSSAAYSADFTIGQSAAGPSSGANFGSPSYSARLGYWSGAIMFRNYIPVVVK
jgi:hypothetical protein